MGTEGVSLLFGKALNFSCILWNERVNVCSVVCVYFVHILFDIVVLRHRQKVNVH